MAKKKETSRYQAPSFQDLILKLERYWADHGCVILQPYDMEMGAATFHPATALRALGQKPWRAAYAQPSRRPKDGRYGENPNRLQHYYQFQVILKPSPPDIQDLYLGSLRAHRHRPSTPRHPLRRGRLGEPDARRLGPRLGGVVRRHGGEPVHLFPAGGRLRLRSRLGRAHLRARAPRHVCAGRRERLRPRFERPRGRQARSPMATSSCRPSRNIRATISSTPTPRYCLRISGRRGRVPGAARRGDRETARHLMALPAYDQCIKAATSSICSTRAA